MKKIFTFLFASLIAATTFAAGHQPTVTINGSRNYEIMIDGRKYVTNNKSVINLTDLRNGQHSVKVYDMKGKFIRKPKLVAASTFRLSNNDVAINVDRSGNVQISESRNGWDRDNRNGKDYGQKRHF